MLEITHDYLGNEVRIGDYVITDQPAGHSAANKGVGIYEVISIAPKSVKIRYKHWGREQKPASRFSFIKATDDQIEKYLVYENKIQLAEIEKEAKIALDKKMSELYD